MAFEHSTSNTISDTSDRNLDLDLQKVTFDYSTKNIPVPTQGLYLKTLINKTEKFVRNLRWRTFFFLNPHLVPQHKETYGFPSKKSPPPIHELRDFEHGLTEIIDSIKFRNVENTFQKKLKSDVNRIKNSDELLVPADKTNNFYKLNR